MKLLLLLLLPSCNLPETQWRAGVGVASSNLSPSLNKSGRSVEVTIGEVRAIFPFDWAVKIPRIDKSEFRTPLFSLPVGADLMIGPSFIVPIANQDAPGISMDAGVRLRIAVGRWEPFLMGTAGAAYFSEEWEPQETQYGFPINVGAGIRYKIDANGWLTGSWRYWHESNGSKIFRTPAPNPGFDAAGVFVAYERRL